MQFDASGLRRSLRNYGFNRGIWQVHGLPASCPLCTTAKDVAASDAAAAAATSGTEKKARTALVHFQQARRAATAAAMKQSNPDVKAPDVTKRLSEVRHKLSNGHICQFTSRS